MPTPFKNDRGATAVEYAIMVALIAVAVIAAVLFLGGTTADLFNSTANEVANL